MKRLRFHRGDDRPGHNRHPINQIQVLGTHNSYHVERPAEILDAYIGVDPDAVDLAYTQAPLTTQLDERRRTRERPSVALG